MHDDGLYLAHILESITPIEEYTRIDKDAFMASRMIQDAVVRNFEIIKACKGRIGKEKDRILAYRCYPCLKTAASQE